MSEILAAGTRLGLVELRVHDLATEVEYYTEGMGLSPISEGEDTVTLGLAEVAILRLTGTRELRPARPGSAGLFHVAIRFEEHWGLAATLLSLLRRHPDSFLGSGDHEVSQAFYFTDPEGNGLELYHDSPRELWRWNDGMVAMDTLELDPVSYINTHLEGMDPLTHPEVTGELGAVHLSVGDLDAAREFYVSTLGFDETLNLGGTALFVSAGGYHHHLAMNTWNSNGAGPRGRTLGLGTVDILVPSADDLIGVVDRLTLAGRETRFDGSTLLVLDPWNTELRLTVG